MGGRLRCDRCDRKQHRKRSNAALRPIAALPRSWLLVRHGLGSQAAGHATPVTVNEVLDGHGGWTWSAWTACISMALCPTCRSAAGGQLLDRTPSFLTAHLGNPIPSPAIFDKIGIAFRRAVTRFAADEHTPRVRFAKDDRKIEAMRPYLAAQAATGRPLGGRARGGPGVRAGVHVLRAAAHAASGASRRSRTGGATSVRCSRVVTTARYRTARAASPADTACPRPDRVKAGATAT